MNLITWIREWINPELKCQRLGHDYQDDILYRLEWPSNSIWSSVADHVEYEVRRCRRCYQLEKDGATPGKEIRRTGLAGLEMDNSRWEELKRNSWLNVTWRI